MTYQEARAFIEQTKQYGSILGLTSIRNLMSELGNVQDSLPIIHLAGTNGKGSVGAMLESVLRQSGYHVGRYTSPAVFAYEEIYQIDGRMIAPEDFAEMATIVQTACEKMVAQGQPHPTAFEVETAIAFCYFAEKKCDLILLETGMGGSTDATNLITHPICSVITSISMDHMAFLGNTLTEIATVKAGIIKNGCPVAAAWQTPEVEHVLRIQVDKMNAPLAFAERDKVSDVHYDSTELRFSYRGFGNVKLSLSGSYQIANAACALETVGLLRQKGYVIPDDKVRKGLQNARWQGRFETIHTKPLCIIDGAHNEEAALLLRESVENCFTNRRITYIIGVLEDKEHEKMLKIMLPPAERVYTVTPDNVRALPAEQLAKEAAKYHAHVKAVDTVEEAVRMACMDAGEDGVVLAFGSLSYLAEVKRAVTKVCR